MSVNRACIQVQQLNCFICAQELKKRLSSVKGISFIDVNHSSSKIHFNFTSANNISDVENILTFLGFNPLGEKIKPKIADGYFCKDSSNKYCINRYT